MPSPNKVYACISHIYSIYKALLRLTLGSQKPTYRRLSAQLESDALSLLELESERLLLHKSTLSERIPVILRFFEYSIRTCYDGRIFEVLTLDFFRSPSTIPAKQRNIDYILNGIET
jgi:hypothetical protein